jgi:Fe-S-cluster containining protein
MFPCTHCGACCIQLPEHLLRLDRGDGTCLNYDERARACKIYATRPPECQIDDAYDRLLSENMSRQAYHRLTATICNELQERQNMDRKYRIDVMNI